MNHPAEALQYLATVASDYVRSLPPSAQGPVADAVNASLRLLSPLVESAPMVNGSGLPASMEGNPDPKINAAP